MYTLDTNTIIYHLKGEEAVATQLKQILSNPSPVYISTITELELFSSRYLTVGEAEVIQKLVASTVTISLDSRIAHIAAAIRREYGLKTPDSAIAATALMTGTTLVTRNVRDFGLNIAKVSYAATAATKWLKQAIWRSNVAENGAWGHLTSVAETCVNTEVYLYNLS